MSEAQESLATRHITQIAPWPDELEDLVTHYRYRPGWTFHLHETFVRDREDPNDFDSTPVCWGTTFDIITWGYNSYHLPNRPEWRDGESVNFWRSETCRDCGQSWPCTAYRQDNDPEKPAQPYRVHHFMPVPAAVFNRQSWQWWILECCHMVERHEAQEFAAFEYERDNQIGIEKFGTRTETERPFRPVHAPGWNPYMLVVVERTDKAQRTSFRGILKDASTT